MAIKVSERIRRTDVVLSMQVEVVIEVSMNRQQYRDKAMNTVAHVIGIESIALREEKNQLAVLGSSFDLVLLAKLLRKKVGHAHLISIRQLGWPNDRSQRNGNSSTNGEVRKPRLHLPSLRLERVRKVFIGCYKPPTSVKNSKRLGDRSSKREPAGNQDFSTGSGSVNPKLPEIRDPLDLDLETTNSEEGLSFVASGIGKPLFLDEPTRLKSRLTFARVCVEVDATKEIPNSFKINLGYCEPYEIKVEVSGRPWSQRHDVSMAIGEASNSRPSRAEEKGKDVVEDSTFASTSIMFDVLDQLTSMEGPRGDNTEMILVPCPSSSTNLDVLASCAPIVENSRGQRKSKGEDKLFSSNKANPSGLVEIEILGTNEEEIEGNLPRELVETLVKKEDEGLVLRECKL